MPSIDPRCFTGDPSGTDPSVPVDGVCIDRRIATQSPLADILDGELAPSAGCGTDAEIGDFVRGHCTTLYHPSSARRMGADPMAVVDPANLAVRGLGGLHVADVSVIPRIVSANVDAPTIMIAERAIAMIRG